MAPLNRSVLFGAATNWLAFAATLAVSFFLTPYLIGSLGTARYDVWCVAESVLAYFTLLDMGIAACLVRYVARHHAAGDPTALNRMASSSLGLYLAAAVVALIVGVPLLATLAPRLEAKAGNPGDITPFLILMLANLAATLPLSVFPSILDGLERFAVKSAVRIVFLALRTTGVILAMEHARGLLPLAMVFTVVNLAEHATMLVLCYRFLPGLRFRVALIDRETLRQVRGYSVDAFLAMLAGRMTLQTGAIVIGLFLPAGQVTAFATAARLVEYAKTLLRTITTTLTPGVSAMEARGDTAGIRNLFLTGTRWVLYLVVPVNLGLWYFGQPFLVRWVPAVGMDASPLLMILAGTLTIGVAQSVASRMLYGLGRLRLFARLALAEAAFNLMLTGALIMPLGVQGVAYAVVIPNILFCAIVIAYTCRVIGVTAREYARVWLPPLGAATTAIAVWSTQGPVEPQWFSIAWAIGLGLLPYGLVVVLWEVLSRRLSRQQVTPAGPSVVVEVAPESDRESGSPSAGASPRSPVPVANV